MSSFNLQVGSGRLLDETGLYQFLETHNFTYQLVHHPAVFTCAESELHRPTRAEVSTNQSVMRFFDLTGHEVHLF